MHVMKNGRWQLLLHGFLRQNNASITTGMAFEQLSRQFTNLLISERNAPGFYDPMFKEDVDMSRLLSYAKEVDEAMKNGTFDD